MDFVTVTATTTATATTAPITTTGYAIYDSYSTSEPLIFINILYLIAVCILCFLLIQWDSSLSSMKIKKRSYSSSIEIVTLPSL